MKVEVNFREKLLLEFLNNLANYGYKEEFMKFYPTMEMSLVKMAKNSNDVSTLSKISEIFDFRKKSIEKQI